MLYNTYLFTFVQMGISWQYSSHIGWGNTQPMPIVSHSTSDFLNNSRLDTTVHCDTDPVALAEWKSQQWPA